MAITVSEFNQYFSELVGGNVNRFGIIFHTLKTKYFFDTGTGKVLSCSGQTYKLLYHLFENNGLIDESQICLSPSELQTSMEDLMHTIETEHIFQAKEFNGLQQEYLCELDKIVGKKCTQLILEVTDECNLRCHYCIYGEKTKNFRGFGYKKMSFETAKKAMDYILPISDMEEMHLSFYGGEPLLNFDFVKQCTEYFKQNYKGEKVSFSLTSNLTLLTDDMAEYFYDNLFYITCSLDGYKEIHNENRVYCDGRGTFDDTINAFKRLVDVYGSQCNLLSINMVISSPYSIDKFNHIQDFFENLVWLPTSVKIRTTYAGEDELDDNIYIGSNMDLIHEEYHFCDDMEDWVIAQVNAGREKDSLYTTSILDSGLTNIQKRRITDIPMDYKGINGCCIPGSRRLYVTVDGDFSVCERIGCSPYIGNVEVGIDVESVKKYYVTEYVEQSKVNCQNCWCIDLCGLCYARAYNEKGIDMKRKKMLCEGERFSNYRFLQKYYMLLEENPDFLLPYNEVEFK